MTLLGPATEPVNGRPGSPLVYPVARAPGDAERIAAPRPAATSSRDDCPAQLLVVKRPLARWLWLVIPALVLRAVLVAVLALTQLVPHNGWYWANDDQVEYYGIGHALIHGQIADAYTFIGYGVLLAPFTVGTEFVLQAMPLAMIVAVALSVPAAFLLYRAGLRLADRRAAAVGTALWLTTPVWLTPIWFHSYSARFAVAPGYLGMQLTVDYASALLAIGVLYVAAGARGDASARRGAVVGVLAGVAFLAKPSNVVIVVIVVTVYVALAVWKRSHAAITMAAVVSVIFVAQLVYNTRLNGNPQTFSYPHAFPWGDPHAIASITYMPRAFGELFLLNYTGPLLGIAATAVLVIAWRRVPATRWLVVAQAVGFALFFSTLYYSISEFMLRFLTPALPGLCLAAGCALVGRRQTGESGAVSVSPPARLSVAACGAAVIAAVALAVFVAVAPMTRVIPQMPSFVIASHVDPASGTVVLRWKAPDAPATLAYGVFRKRSGEDSADQEFVWAGTATTTSDRPGPGVWRYRVLVNPGYRPGGLPPAVTHSARSPCASRSRNPNRLQRWPATSSASACSERSRPGRRPSPVNWPTRTTPSGIPSTGARTPSSPATRPHPGRVRSSPTSRGSSAGTRTALRALHGACSSATPMRSRRRSFTRSTSALPRTPSMISSTGGTT